MPAGGRYLRYGQAAGLSLVSASMERRSLVWARAAGTCGMERQPLVSGRAAGTAAVWRGGLSLVVAGGRYDRAPVADSLVSRLVGWSVGSFVRSLVHRAVGCSFLRYSLPRGRDRRRDHVTCVCVTEV